MHRAGAQAARISCLDQPRLCLPYWLQTPVNCAHGCRCNPSGAVLTSVADNVWGAERPFTWNRIDVGGRGAVIKLSDGTIWTQASKCGGAARCLQMRGCCTCLSSMYERHAPLDQGARLLMMPVTWCRAQLSSRRSCGTPSMRSGRCGTSFHQTSSM